MRLVLGSVKWVLIVLVMLVFESVLVRGRRKMMIELKVVGEANMLAE